MEREFGPRASPEALFLSSCFLLSCFFLNKKCNTKTHTHTHTHTHTATNPTVFKCFSSRERERERKQTRESVGESPCFCPSQTGVSLEALFLLPGQAFLLLIDTHLFFFLSCFSFLSNSDKGAFLLKAFLSIGFKRV